MNKHSPSRDRTKFNGHRQLFASLTLFIVAACFSPEAMSEPSLQDVSSLVKIEYGGFRLDHSTGQLVQRLRLRNVSRSRIEGQLVLYLTHLSPGLKIGNPDSRANEAIGAQKQAPNDGVAISATYEPIEPGKTRDVVVRFQNPQLKKIRYETVTYQVKNAQ